MDARVKPAHDEFPHNCELLRVACNDKLHACLRQTNPTGKSRKTMSIPLHENIPLASSGKSVI